MGNLTNMKCEKLFKIPVQYEYNESGNRYYELIDLVGCWNAQHFINLIASINENNIFDLQFLKDILKKEKCDHCDLPV
jgi:hypothetical protein